MATENKAKKKSRGKSVILILLLIIVIAAAGGGYYLSTMNKALSPGSDKIILVEVASGDTTTAIADKLEEKGVIASAQKFRLKSRLSGNDGKYKAGVYEVSPAMTAEEIMDKLISGDQEQNRLTIPEGYTLDQGLRKLRKRPESARRRNSSEKHRTANLSIVLWNTRDRERNAWRDFSIRRLTSFRRALPLMIW